MNQGKAKATDYVVESLKLIFTLSTILFGGLLAYRASLNVPTLLWAYYSSLAALVLSALFSVANINSLINKVFRGDEEAIQHKEAKRLNVLSLLSLLAGMVFGAMFLSDQVPEKVASVAKNQTVITEAQIIVGGGVQSNIKVSKDSDGRITEVTITPK